MDLKPEAAYSETRLENAIIDKMQGFLLEMGKGFLFEAHQKRFTFDEDNYYVDLVFYNRLLQCYVLIDLKVDKLTLPKDSNINAAQYDLYLPDKNELQARRKSWIEEFEEQED